MKFKLLLILVFLLILWNCKSSSVSKQNLIIENKVLKERLAQFEKIDTSNIDAVIEVNKMNIIYRGVRNPIKISMPHAIKIEAIGEGLSKIDDFGNYTLIASSGNFVDVNVLGIMPNTDTISRTKRLRIKNIGKPIGIINGLGCGTKCEVLLTAEELKNAKIAIKFYDFLFDWSFTTKSFKIKFPNQKSLEVDGDQITNDLEEYIQNLKEEDEVVIFDIKMKIIGQALMKPPSPILIRIIED